MSNLLTEEFFKRDLTEAEAEAMDHLLENSTEDALRFGENLKAEYLALGLAVPEIPKHWGLPHPAASGLSLVKAALTALLLAGAGALAWHYGGPAASMKTETAIPVLPAPAPAMVRHEAPLPPPPIEIPQRLEGASEEGGRLSVVVEMDKAAPVKVTILNGQDQPVRALYNGVLSAGKWSLHWDGLTADGSKAAPGGYRIKVESGSSRMSKTVSIEPGN